MFFIVWLKILTNIKKHVLSLHCLSNTVSIFDDILFHDETNASTAATLSHILTNIWRIQKKTIHTKLVSYNQTVYTVLQQTERSVLLFLNIGVNEEKIDLKMYR